VAVTEVHVIEQPIRLLYVEHWPRWQYQFLRNAVRRDHRFEAHLVLMTEDPATPIEERQTASFPTTQEELETFDAIVLGDLSPQDLSPQQWDWVRDHVVDNGAGMVLIAGPRHMPGTFIDTPIGPLLPFERVVSTSADDVEPFQPAVTPLGVHHPLMRLGFGDDPLAAWQQLPRLQWFVGVEDLKPGAMVLAERPGEAGGDPTALVIIQRVGKGSVLYVGTDETWRWRYEVGNRYFYGFWAHAIQHVGMRHHVREFSSVRIEPASGRVSPDVPVRVNVSMEMLSDVEQGIDETLTLIAESSVGLQQAFELRRAADSPFVYAARVQLAAPGPYRLYVEGYEDRGEATVEVLADGAAEPELADPAVDSLLLRQVAELSGGQFVSLEGLDGLINELDLSPLRYRWSERVPLWDGWMMLSILALLLTAEWVLRKWLYLP
jgi:hypothetical protein